MLLAERSRPDTREAPAEAVTAAEVVPGPRLPRARRGRRRGRRPLLAALGSLVLTAGIMAADLAQPAFPAVGAGAVAWALALALGVLVVALRPRSGAARGAVTLCILPLLGFAAAGAAQLADGGARGLLGGREPAVAAWQDAWFGAPPRPVADAEMLRAALDGPAARPLAGAASADELLFNALVLRRRDDAPGATLALAAALRLEADPRPDALLLLEGLPGTSLPEDLQPEALDHIGAMQRADAGERAAALTAVVAAQPEALHSRAALARALVAASLPRGPTLATAARIAEAIAPFDEPDRFLPFAERFLDQAEAFRLRAEMRGLAWAAEVAARPLAVAVATPPAGQPDAPILLHVLVPEPVTAVQVSRGEADWVPLAADQAASPTLAMARPFRREDLRLRYLDRDGVASAVFDFTFDPAPPLRRQAQRTLTLLGTFGLYLPGRVSEGRLNPLPLAGHLRAGLTAVEWATDAEPVPRLVPVGVPDEVVVAGAVPRALVEMSVSDAARVLRLTAIFADGSRSPTAEMLIR